MLRVALALFVLAWIFGPHALRSMVPIWLPFLIAVGLELNFFAGALHPAPARRADRGPQAVDLERYGYADEGDEELWIPAERRLPVRRLLAGLAVIGALAVTLWVVESNTGWKALGADTRAEAAARFSEEASRIAEKPVTVHCDEAGDYVGAVQHADGAAAVGGSLAYLTPERCLDLYRLAFEGEVRPSQTARALAVLAHEAWHLRGVRDEGTTECYALQAGVEIGRRLGLSGDRARQLMRQQLVENELRTSTEYLVSPDCRDGGRLDLDPNDSRFP